ncbi:MAG TPA: FAD-dependent oxidoreductase [Candidatus Kapabacteria bacterium]|nr:FAD-dependent oxidoreductase [Candidatus Kapabacteria bacterium]
MKKTIELVLSPATADDKAAQITQAAKELAVSEDHITSLRVKKRSIDARSKNVRVRLQTDIYIDEAPPTQKPIVAEYKEVTSNSKRVIIVGAGPAGMFAALKLIERGIRPIILERGKDVQARRRDLAAIQKEGIVNPDSNYCFGEGGAGTYSDGKLYTRSTKRGNVEEALQVLVAHGAHPDIMIDAHPHIGSNNLPKVVAAMRESILKAGGEIHFNSAVTDLIINNKTILGVQTRDGKEFLADVVIIATGHSARDIFRLLHSKNITIEAKPFAMGVRVEHPQLMVDKDQYHSSTRDPNLPAASYKLVAQASERGVFSFCMCPGGFIIPAATAPGELVLNGMSLSRRDSPFANSGIVVAIDMEDLKPYEAHGVFAGVEYQSELERMAFTAGGGTQAAPAQRLTDFINSRVSTSLPNSSYQPGMVSSPLHELLPPAISKRLQQGFQEFGKKMTDYLTDEAVILGVETRTSSPIRIPRDTETLEHPDCKGLYPCGEGAGYAGGIISAALDGVRVAEAIDRLLNN